MPPPRVSNSTGKINDLRDSFRHDVRCSEHRYSENFDAICNTSQDESSPWTTITAFFGCSSATTAADGIQRFYSVHSGGCWCVHMAKLFLRSTGSLPHRRTSCPTKDTPVGINERLIV